MTALQLENKELLVGDCLGLILLLCVQTGVPVTCVRGATRQTAQVFALYVRLQVHFARSQVILVCPKHHFAEGSAVLCPR